MVKVAFVGGLGVGLPGGAKGAVGFRGKGSAAPGGALIAAVLPVVEDCMQVCCTAQSCALPNPAPHVMHGERYILAQEPLFAKRSAGYLQNIQK